MLTLAPGVSVPPATSASPTAVRRLQKDYAKLMEDPVAGILALPNEDNILEWHYCLSGSPDTNFQGGYYWGKVIFKENFPWAPPAITMITPNGRFATNVRLCLSISDYHPESWNPGWTVSAILIGLHSFMNENQPAAGSVPGSPQEQKNLAAASKEFNVKYREFRRFFPTLVKEWTGVYPTPGEPNVAPTMLPEHATPKGIAVPTIQAHGSRAAYANRGFEDMLNVMHAGMRPVGAGAGPPVPVVRRAEVPIPQIVPAVGGGPAYQELAAMAAAQQRARDLQAQAADQQQRMLAQVAQMAGVRMAGRVDPRIRIPPRRQQAEIADDELVVELPAQGQPEPPQQRILRPRRGEDGRRAEMLARLGMDQQGGEAAGGAVDGGAVPVRRQQPRRGVNADEAARE